MTMISMATAMVSTGTSTTVISVITTGTSATVVSRVPARTVPTSPVTMSAITAPIAAVTPIIIRTGISRSAGIITTPVVGIMCIAAVTDDHLVMTATIARVLRSVISVP